MKITVNGKFKEYNEDKKSLKDILACDGVESLDTISVQLNGNFIDKEKFENTIIKNGDEIDYLYFMGGGN